MKTAETLQTALTRYEQELTTIRQKIKELDDAWERAGAVMDNRDFFTACVQKEMLLRKQEAEAEFRIKFTKWVFDS